ncbi:MAG: toxin-antitoxin system HicB family antitoxin [Dehalococcoidales bacterium]|jgi:predicted HicB family RNase H-like nuclease
MKDANLKRPKERMVHVRLPEELHKRLRIKAAEEDTTLQDWVAMAIRNELDRQNHEKDKGAL